MSPAVDLSQPVTPTPITEPPSGPDVDGIDYEHLSSLVAKKVADLVSLSLSSRRSRKPKKRKGRCMVIQVSPFPCGSVICTYSYLSAANNHVHCQKGLGISKMSQIGLDEQPTQFDLDANDKAPWQINWQECPDHLLNVVIVTRWINKVPQDKMVS